LENGQDYIGNISGACNLAPFADLRNIIAASLIEEKRTGNEEYNVIAREAQDIMNAGFDDLFSNMDTVGDKTQGGRREVPIVASALNFMYEKFPEKSLNPNLSGHIPKIGKEYSRVLPPLVTERDNLLERYQQLKSI
ncbi:hypothetical protein HON49_06985, partial [archaeon]|nr:hypothetical protein [archaeon]